jgi:hypothetical protein
MNELILQNRAISLWAEAQAYRFIVGRLTQQETAQAITEMGRGIRPGRLEGVEYPPDYKISQPGVLKAFRRYCQRKPPPGLAEMRRVDTQRCDDIYRAMLSIIRGGGRGTALAADAATRALAHKARITTWSVAISDNRRAAGGRLRQH